jgi:hypothetical protein
MLHMVERDQAVKEHEHRVKQANFVAQFLRQPLDEAHHVVAEVADRTGNERRQSRKANRPKTLNTRAQKRNGIFFFPNDAIAALQNARAICITKNFFGIRTGKRVTRDFFAAFHALQQERMPRTLCDAEIRADGCEQVGGKNVINRYEIALFGEALKFGEGRLNHRTRDPLGKVTVYTRRAWAVFVAGLPKLLLRS